MRLLFTVKAYNLAANLLSYQTRMLFHSSIARDKNKKFAKIIITNLEIPDKAPAHKTQGIKNTTSKSNKINIIPSIMN